MKIREYEFRGKRADNGEWVTGSLIQSDDATYIFDRKKNFSPVTEIPEYHYQGMGCGLEDRCIHDRYEAMAHGWNEAVDRLVEKTPDFYEVLPETVCEASDYTLPDGRRVFEGDKFSVENDKGETVVAVCERGMAGRTMMGNDVDISCFYFRVDAYGGKKTFPIVNNYAGVHDLSMFRYIGTVHDEEVKG